MTGSLTARDLLRLQGVHPDLVKVVQAAAQRSPVAFEITEGLRTAEEEYALWATCHNLDGSRNVNPWKTNCNGYPVGTKAPSGADGTGESRHQHGHAIDFVVLLNGNVVWEPLDLYHHVADAFLQAGAQLRIPVIYGGNWLPPKTDSDHIELNQAFYPIA